MTKLRAIFKSHGGKAYLKDFIISNFPKNYIQLKYIEGCGGAASVLLNKQPSITEAFNDADPGIAGIVQELVSNPKNFISAVEKLSYSQETFEWAKIASKDSSGMEQSVAELARRRMSRGGLRESFSWSNRQRGGQAGDVNAWETFKVQLPFIAERLHNVNVHCLPVIDLLSQFDAADVLWYIDPPYLSETRTVSKVYNIEMSKDDHLELAEFLNAAKGKVALSGYQSSLYAKLYKNWNLYSRPIANHSSQQKKKEKRVELLWTNY